MAIFEVDPIMMWIIIILIGIICMLYPAAKVGRKFMDNWAEPKD